MSQLIIGPQALTYLPYNFISKSSLIDESQDGTLIC